MNNFSYTFAKSRSGETVPGCPQPLHSMVDPKREAQRLVSTIGNTANTGFVVFLGLGGGFAPEAALEFTNAHVVVIDFDKDSIAQLFANRDYSKLLTNSRFSLLVDADKEEIKNFIIEHFKPALCGGIKTIPLRGRVEKDQAKFDNAVSGIREAIEIASGDYSVQTHFGFRWFSNIIRNIKHLTAGCDSFFAETKHNINNTAIVAAGPSLDHQLQSLAEFKSRKGFIISSDTALGALLHNGIEPDAVVSIDCQHISYYHFMGCNLRNTPLVLDIASPPLLSGFSTSPVFFSSGHPLARYIRAHWRPFTQLDTSGGNVTYTCLSLAETLGAQYITLFGADFSYVKSQSYARGTYIYPYFFKKQNRLSTLEAQFSAFLYRSPFLPPEDGKKKNYYETASLRFYRKKLEEKASMMRARINCEQGQGAPVNLRSAFTKNETKKQRNGGYDKTVSGTDFLLQYRNDIAALPAANEKDDYIKSLSEKERQVFLTLLPLAAAVKKRNTELELQGLIKEVKRFCIQEIERALS